MPKSISVGKATTSQSLWFQYAGVVSQKLKSAGFSVSPREDDLKKEKEWMDKTRKPCELVLIYDGNGLDVEARVGSNKEYLVQLSIDKDVRKRREALENISKVFPQLVSKADLDAYDKAHPDPDKLKDMKAQIDAKAAEIKDLEKKLADARKAKADLDRSYKDLGGK